MGIAQQGDQEAAEEEDRKVEPDELLTPICPARGAAYLRVADDRRHVPGGRFNAQVLQDLMGHASIVQAFRYGHLMPGLRGEGAGLLDAYL